MDVQAIKKYLEAIVAERCGTAALCALTPPNDKCDVAFANGEKECEAVALTKRGLRMERARIALDRIANGTYGTCLACGKAIAEKRLNIKAVPETPFCGGCQTKLENDDLPGFEHFAEPKPAQHAYF